MSEINPKIVDGEPVCSDDCPLLGEYGHCLSKSPGCYLSSVLPKFNTSCVPGLRQQRDEALKREKELQGHFCMMYAACKIDGAKRGQKWLDRYSYQGNTWEDQTKLAIVYAKERDWHCFDEDE